MIENDRQYSITKTQTERFSWALEQLQSGKQDGKASFLAEVSENAIRSQLGDLRDELRQYEARKAREAEFDALAADIPETIADEDLPEGRMLTEEEDREMKENLAQKNFGKSFAEFAKAWNAGEFDDDRERHGDVIFLASMLPEYWTD